MALVFYYAAQVIVFNPAVVNTRYLWPTLVVQTDKYRPNMVGFGYFYAGGPGYAYLTIATLPVLIIFFLFQRSFIKSISQMNYSR